MQRLVVTVAIAAGVLALGVFIGMTIPPGDWYAGLQKPWFTPPNWLFGPVWSVLYVLIGWVGARKLYYGGERGLWLAQTVLNFAWTPVFFGLHLMTTGLAVIVVLWATVLAFIIREWRADRLSAALFLPYLAWLTLASALNAAIVLLN